MAKLKGLGRGLDALFAENENDAAVRGIRLNDIEPNPDQPRRSFDEEALAELAESIRENGIITPLSVRRRGDRYEIIAGERRWRAARMAGLREVPALVLEADDTAAYRMALVENLQREDLDPIEEAEGYQRLMRLGGLTQEQAAQQVGKSRPAVANAVRLLALPESVREMLRRRELSSGHARALLSLGKAADMEAAARTAAERGLSVRETERLCAEWGKAKKARQPKPDLYVRELEHEMSAATGRRVSIAAGRKKGRITLEYFGNEDLERICEALKKISKA